MVVVVVECVLVASLNIFEAVVFLLLTDLTFDLCLDCFFRPGDFAGGLFNEGVCGEVGVGGEFVVGVALS